MSLRSFHIVFIVIASLSAFFFGGWGLEHTVEGERPFFLLGLAFLFVGTALIAYGIWFLRKLRMREMSS